MEINHQGTKGTKTHQEGRKTNRHSTAKLDSYSLPFYFIAFLWFLRALRALVWFVS
jgi:hypothetical protein